MFRIIIILLSVIFLVMPAALGYWYMGTGNPSFQIPFSNWLIPAANLFVLAALAVIPPKEKF